MKNNDDNIIVMMEWKRGVVPYDKGVRATE